MRERIDKHDLKMPESVRRHVYLLKPRRMRISAAYVHALMQADTLSTRKRFGGYVQFVLRRLYEKMTKRNPTLSRRVS